MYQSLRIVVSRTVVVIAAVTTIGIAWLKVFTFTVRTSVPTISHVLALFVPCKILICVSMEIVEIPLIIYVTKVNAKLTELFEVFKDCFYFGLHTQVLVKPFWFSHHYLLLYGMVKGFLGSVRIAIYDLATILIILANVDYNISARITGIYLDI